MQSFPLSGNKIQSLDQQIENINSLVPRHPTTIYLSAGIGKSKTTTVLNLLLNKDAYWQKFNRIIVISPTAESDIKWSLLKQNNVLTPNTKLIKHLKKDKHLKIFDDEIEKETFNTKLDDEDFHLTPNVKIIQDLVNEQKAIIKSYGKEASDKVLLILDDCINETSFFKSSDFKGLLLKTRHLNCSIIMISQDYRSLPKPLRNNIKAMFLSKSPSIVEMKLMYDENKTSKSFKEWSDIFNKFDTYDFMQISYQNDINHQLIKNFEAYLTLE